jgi:hypothetical protein
MLASLATYHFVDHRRCADPAGNTLMTRSRPSAVLTLVLLGMALSLGLSEQASAQGTSGTVPDPISARDLEAYCDRLGLSDQQRQAVQGMHDQYREEFTRLRETDIEHFLQDARKLQGMGFGALQQRDDVVKSLRNMESVLGKIKAVDNRLFDQVQTVLSEEQILQLPRVRQARERQRYSSGLTRMTGFMNPATQIDVSVLAMDIDLPPDTLAIVDPLLQSYENTLTGASRKLHDATTKMVLDMLDRLAAAGISQDGMRDNERRGQMWAAMRDAWTDVNVELLDKAAEISELNRKTVRTLGQVMPGDSARQLHDDYFQRAYPEAFVSSGPTTRAFAAALKLESLTDEQRQTVQAAAVEYRTSTTRIADQMADLIDENRRTRSIFDFNQGQGEYQDTLRTLREKRAALSTSAMDSLKATLGPELTEQVEKRVAAAESAAEKTPAEFRALSVGGPGGPGLAMRIATNATMDSSNPLADPYLPGPITERVSNAYATQLDLDGDNKVIYDSLYDDYRERFEAVQKVDIQAVLDANATLWSMPNATPGGGSGGGGSVKPPSVEDIERLYSLRKKALQSIMQADDSFFEEIKTTLLSDKDAAALERVKLARKREVYNREFAASGMGGPMMFAGRGPGGGRGGRNATGSRGFGFFGSGSEESSLDLAIVLEAVSLSTDERAAVDQTLRDYEKTATDAFRKQYDSTLRMRQAMDKAVAQSAQSRAAGENMQMGAYFRELMEADGRASREASRELSALNRATRDTIMAMLSSAAQQELRQSYNRKAYAEIFRDPQSASTHLTAALRLEDLSPQQRSTINDLSVEYHASYDQLSERMIELQASSPQFDPGGPPEARDWQAMQDRQRSMEKLTFDRNDLSDKAMSRLKVVLSDEQTQRIGVGRDETETE